MPDILIRGAVLPEIQDNHGIKAELRRVGGVLELGTMTGGYSCCEQWTFYPIHELPEHGDLKDADYIRNKLCEMYKSDTLENDHFYGNAALDNVLYTMDNTPVIVPASEEVE